MARAGGPTNERPDDRRTRSRHFRGRFEFDGVSVRVDVRERLANGAWGPKSSAGPKDYHFDDIALQRYVLKGPGIVVSSAEHTDVNTRLCARTRRPETALNPLSAATHSARAVRASRRRGGLAPECGLRGGEAGDRDTKRRT